MRALWMCLFVAVIATSCSTADDPVEASRSAQNTTPVENQADSDERSEGAARTLGEPSGAEPGEALAFEQTVEGDPSTEDVVDGPRSDEGDDDADGARQTPGDAEPATPLSRLVDQLIEFVEEERGHAFTSRPGVTLLDGPAFAEAWETVIEEDAAKFAEEYDDFTDIYRATGIIDGSADLEEIWMRFGDAGVLGYYEPETGDIVLRSGEITALTKTVLVHELVHALDDQVFGLDRSEYDARDDEIDWTFSALIEGSAGEIEERYRATLSQAERDEETAARNALPRTVSLSEFTTSFLELQFGRYQHGDAFVAALWDDGQAAVDDAFLDPPATSEVVIDHGAYVAGEGVEDVDTPPADGPAFRSGVWGEAAWGALFADAFGPFEGLDLADGWGGDRYVAWRNGDETCVRIHVAGDSAAVLDDYAFAIEEWVTLASGREVFYPTADLVRLTACG